MAQSNGSLSFIGSIGNLSAYKMQGNDKIIIRTKGGPSKQQIKNAPNLAGTRRQNAEWKGVIVASNLFRNAMAGIKHLANYNITGATNGLCKHIQLADTAGTLGSRNILLANHPQMLEGFSLNERNGFDSIVRLPIQIALQKDPVSALVQFPALLPNISFKPASKAGWYRLVACLGAVTNVVYDEATGMYTPVEDVRNILAMQYSPWLPVQAERPATELVLQPAFTASLPPQCCLVVSVGIEMGAPNAYGQLQYIPYSGAGKVIKVE